MNNRNKTQHNMKCSSLLIDISHAPELICSFARERKLVYKSIVLSGHWLTGMKSRPQYPNTERRIHLLVDGETFNCVGLCCFDVIVTRFVVVRPIR